MSETITLKIKEIPAVFSMLDLMIDFTDQPFRGHARRLVFNLQPELRFLQEISAEDYEQLKETEVEFGPRIPAPSTYADEHAELLKKICTHLPAKNSRIQRMMKQDKEE